MEGLVVNLFIGFFIGVAVGNDRIRGWFMGFVRGRKKKATGNGKTPLKTRQSLADLVSGESAGSKEAPQYVQYQNPTTREWVLISQYEDGTGEIVKRRAEPYEGIKVITDMGVG